MSDRRPTARLSDAWGVARPLSAAEAALARRRQLAADLLRGGVCGLLLAGSGVVLWLVLLSALP